MIQSDGTWIHELRWNISKNTLPGCKSDALILTQTWHAAICRLFTTIQGFCLWKTYQHKREARWHQWTYFILTGFLCCLGSRENIPKHSEIKRPHVLRGTQLNQTRILTPCTLSDKATGCVSHPIKPQRKRHDEGRQVLVQQWSFSAGSLVSCWSALSILHFHPLLHVFCSAFGVTPLLPSSHTLAFAAIQYAPQKGLDSFGSFTLAPLPVFFCLCEGKSW